MGDELRNFMRVGLDKYPDAFAAVDRFQTEVQQAIKEVLVSRSTWNAFTLNASPSTNAGGRAGQGCWVYAMLSGALPGKKKEMLEVGLWWNAPQGPTLVAYANPYWGAKDLESLRRAHPTAPVRVGTLDGKARFFAEVVVDEDLRPQVERVVEELTKFLDDPSWKRNAA